MPRLNPIKSALLTLVCLLVPISFDYLTAGPDLLPYEYSSLVIIILYILNTLINYFIEIRNKQKIVNIFGQYIPPQLVEEINKSPGQISLAGETKEMTVLFSDLYDFTTFLEEIGPQKITKMLNAYFTEMSNILLSCNATIDKFIGDSIMAFWGAPLQQNDHARLSIIAGFKMQQAITRLRPMFAGHGWEQVQMGIGISTGKMHVGNMGSQHRVSYTVVGDNVNLASRLEHLTRHYGVPTIVNEATMRKNSDYILFRELDTVTVKGKKLENKIFQPLCMLDNKTAAIASEIERQQQALDYYYQKDFQRSANMFSQLAETCPQDNYYIIMHDKITALSES